MPGDRLHNAPKAAAARTKQGDKLRMRAGAFADHYSQARLFWKSLTDSERAHIASSFVFELSKVELEQVPPRMVANLRNVDEELAQRVANGLGIDLPKKSPARARPIDIEAIAVALDPKEHEGDVGRPKVGILIADGSEAGEVAGLKAARRKGWWHGNDRCPEGGRREAVRRQGD